MPKDVMTDSAASNDGQSTAAPEEAPEPTLGQGLMEPDKFAGDPPDAPEQSDVNPPATSDDEGEPEGEPEKDTEDTQKQADELSEDEQHKGYLRYSDYTRKAQDLADQRKQLEQEQKRLADERNNWLSQREQLLQQQAQQQGSSDQPTSLVQRLEGVMQSPDVSPQDRAGLQVITDIARENEQLKGQLTQLQQQFEQVAPQVETVSQQASKLTEQQNKQLVDSLKKQYSEAVSLFGEDAARSSMEFIRRNIQTPNPNTGEPYTIAELVAMATGKSMDEVRDARASTRNQRQKAKKDVSSHGAHPQTQPTGENWSRSQALAAIRQTL